MKNSKILIFLSLLLILFLAIGAISASALDDRSLDNSMAVNDNISSENSNNTLGNNSSDESNSSTNDTKEPIYTKYSSITKQYNKDNIDYKVKVYSIKNFEGYNEDFKLNKSIKEFYNPYISFEICEKDTNNIIQKNIVLDMV